jgi:hypothetical protein
MPSLLSLQRTLWVNITVSVFLICHKMDECQN